MKLIVYGLLLLVKTCHSLDMNNLTEFEVNEYRENNSHLMKFVIQENTIYTDPNTIQVTDENLFYTNDDIDFVDKSKPYRGSAPVGFYVTNAVGRTLGDVLKEAIDDREDLFEGMVWIRNVIESIGITTLHRFCSLTQKLMKTQVYSWDKYFDRHEYFLFLLKETFKKYKLRTEPIDDLLFYINEFYDGQRTLKNYKKKRIFNESCEEFKSRYGKFTNLVHIHPRSSIDELPLNSRLIKPEIKSLIQLTKKVLKGSLGFENPLYINCKLYFIYFIKVFTIKIKFLKCFATYILFYDHLKFLYLVILTLNKFLKFFTKIQLNIIA